MASIDKQVVHRKEKFSIQEDVQLSHLHLEIFQDLVDGINQRKDKVWERIDAMWNQGKPEFDIRIAKFFQIDFLISVIIYVSKYHGTIRQVKNRNSSNVSEKYIVSIG